MRALHVIPGLDETDGGPFHTLPKLWKFLAAEGVDVRAYTTHWGPTSELGGEVPVIRVMRTLPGICYNPRLGRLLRREAEQAALVHDHGCWLYPNWAAGRAARARSKPLVISPLGHLDPWSLKQHPRRKQWVRKWFEEENWRYCRAWIAKSTHEANALRSLQFPGEIHVVPNGIDSTEWASLNSAEIFLREHEELRGRRICLFLSRLHPKKGAHHLLHAWSRLHNRHRDWVLVIAGAVNSSYARELRSRAAADSFHEDTVYFVGELDPALKRAAFVASSLFVLPSESENFGQAILESLAAGVPVVTTQACPWKGIEEHDCGWWIRTGEGALQLGLDRALREPADALKQRGARARAWVAKEFDWKIVARQLKDVYSCMA